jgi:tRNA 2-thiouridine synthesizing protein B
MKPENMKSEGLDAEDQDVFLLTKPPFSPRSELCLNLAARSGNARLYLAGDGVYHLLAGTADLPGCQVYACKEDLEARGITAGMTGMTEMAEEKMAGEKVKVPENFYATLTEDLMENCRRAYTF